MNVAHSTYKPPEPLERIVNLTPDQHNEKGEKSEHKKEEESQQSQQKSQTSASQVAAPGLAGKKSTADTGHRKLANASLRNSQTSTGTAPTVAVTEAETLSARNSSSTIATEASSSQQHAEEQSARPLQFYKTQSQRKLQEQLQRTPPSARSSLSSLLRLEEEEMDEGLHHVQVRAGIETARRSLDSVRKWNTPYDIDPPRRIRLASCRSIATTDTSSTDFTCESDPMIMERQIWNGIEALMAEAFSDGGESVCTADVLPKSLLRAMSHSSVSVTTSDPHSHLTPEEEGEIQMAQIALNSFMDMLLPEGDTKEGSNNSTMPSLETMKDSESHQDRIAMAEVALHNFMDVLLHDLEDDTKSSSDHSSKVQILDLFQWSLKVNVDAQEKICYLEAERARLEEERQRELEELMETERRLEQERARRRIEEEKRRRKIRELEQHLAQEQRALAMANKKTHRAMKRNRYRQPAIPEEQEQNDLWPGGKPVVMKDDGSIDPATLTRRQARGVNPQQGFHGSSGDISNESENEMRYIVTSSEPSPQKAPELEQEGPPPRHADVKRMPSWTIIGEKRLVMASTDSVESFSQESNVTNHLPSSFHENDKIRNLSDSDSSRKGRRRRYSSGSVGRALSVSSSLDMPDLASINEDSVLGSIDSPPYVSTGGDMVARQYPGGVPRVASATLRSQPSMRHTFERVPSSGRVGLVSASGDVFTDDVSRYSFSRFGANETKQEESPDPRKRHTELLSVGSAGDIHQLVGKDVRFNESPDSSGPDDHSSSSSEDVTLDSDLHRDAQTDAKKPVPTINRRYGSGGKKNLLGGRLKKSIKAIRHRGKCVTDSWFCESANKRYGDISKQSKRLEKQQSQQLEKLASQECLLHVEDDPYDRTHVLEPTRLTIDDTGFVIDRR